MIATDAPCKACGFVFYGFAYAGEACSAECDEALRDGWVNGDCPEHGDGCNGRHG